jgi:hypothetical protein
MWKEKPGEVVARMSGGGKQGSGAALRKRSVPTYSEGLARGLTPRYANPIDAMMAYNENMAKFLATHEIKDAMVSTKMADGKPMASWHYPGQQPHGYVPLEGMLTKRRPRGSGRKGAPRPDQPVPLDALPPPGERGVARTGGGPGGPGLLGGPEGEPPGTPPASFRGGDLVPQTPEVPQGQVGAGEQPAQIEDAAAKARRVGPTEPEVVPPTKKARDRPPLYQQLYAPEDAARVYNNHISRGLDRPGDIGPVYRGARAAANGVSQLLLGLSAFHAAVMGQEGIISEVALGIQQLFKGDVKGAAIKAAASPVAPVRLAMRGRKMEQQILGNEKPGTMDARLNDTFERAGGRLSMSKIYSTRASGSFFTSLMRGTLVRDVKDSMGRIFGDNPSLLDRGKGIADLAGNIIQSTAAPIFEKYIPATKRGSWARRMEQYLKENPNVTDDELVKKGREVLDSTDNRFGELLTDNNFWNKTAYQIAQLLTLSPSWDIGTVREIGGGVGQIPESLKGIVQGKGITDKTAYVAALLSVTAMQNAVATKLHTGENPTDLDFFAYRTGGVNADGSPERAMIPGYMKDVLALLFEGPKKVLMNKLHPALSEAYELANGKDWRGYPIGAELPGEKGYPSYFADKNLPISLQKARAGSKITPAERALAIKPAPGYLQNPARQKSAADHHDLKMHIAKVKADRKKANRESP